MNRRRFLVESGKGLAGGLAGLVLGLAGSTGCATAGAPSAEPEKRKSKYPADAGYVPRKEAEEVVRIVENYGTLNEEPSGDKTYHLNVTARLSDRETRIYSIAIFYQNHGRKLQFTVESNQRRGPRFHRVYHDTGIDGTLDLVMEGFASRLPDKFTFAYLDVEKRQITTTEFDDVTGRKVSQKPMDGESLRSLYAGYRDDLAFFLNLYAPKNYPSVPTGEGVMAML